MLLKELFTTQGKFKLTDNGAHFVSYDFEVNDKQFFATFDSKNLQGGKWFFIFETGEGEIGITGESGKDVFAIFSTIIAITKDFIAKRKPTEIVFSADGGEPSRVKLYKRLLKIFERYGWQIKMKKFKRTGDVMYSAIAPNSQQQQNGGINAKR